MRGAVVVTGKLLSVSTAVYAITRIHHSRALCGIENNPRCPLATGMFPRHLYSESRLKTNKTDFSERLETLPTWSSQISYLVNLAFKFHAELPFPHPGVLVVGMTMIISVCIVIVPSTSRALDNGVAQPSPALTSSTHSSSYTCSLQQINDWVFHTPTSTGDWYQVMVSRGHFHTPSMLTLPLRFTATFFWTVICT